MPFKISPPVLVLVAPLGLLMLLGSTRPAQAELSGTPVWGFESDAAGARLGLRAATAGDVNGDGYSDILVTAPFYSGAQTSEGKAWCFLGSPTGPAASAHWVREGNLDFSFFGNSIAGAGDVNGDGYDDVIIGAPLYDDSPNQGRAFVYHGSAIGLGGAPNWIMGDGIGAEFGQRVIGAGDVNGDGYDDVVVAAPYWSGGQSFEGKAFLFLGSASGLATDWIWSGEGNVANGHYGAELSPAGDVNGDGYDDVLVGAPDYDNGNTDEGAAWLYLGGPGGLQNTELWRIEGDGDDERCGSELGCAGDVNGDGYSDIMISFDYGGNAGYVFVYHGGPTGTDTSADRVYTGPDLAFGDGQFTAGDVNGDGHADVVIGNWRADGSVTDQGVIYLYKGAAGNLEVTPTNTIWGPSSQTLTHFGETVTTAGDVNGDGYSDVIVGEQFFENGQSDEGKAYVYLGSPSKDEGTVDWTDESHQTGAGFGISAASGDWNADGFSDVAVDAWFYDNGETNEGVAYVYLGRRDSGLISTPSWSQDADQANAYFGYSLATAGDVNGDGYEDLLVGAPYYDGDQVNEGHAFLYYGSVGGPEFTTAWLGQSVQADAHFGWSVASAGDVDGDGYSDVIVGAPDFDGGQINEGIAFVYHGSVDGLALDSRWARQGNEAAAGMGFSVASAGDVNADGYSDVIVGAPDKSNGQSGEGVAYVYHGSAAGLSLVPSAILDSDQVASNFGLSVASAGDVNGDGYSDVIVGASLWDNGNSNEGAAFVYLGGPSGVSTIAAWSVESGQDNARRGEDVASAGDVNNDGYSDVVVGTPYYTGTLTDEGRATVFFGGPSGLASSSTWIVNGGQAGARFGAAVASAGDVNGDGFGDVVIGAPDYDNGQDGEGRAVLYFGNEDGLDRAVTQMRTDGVTPISLLGISDSDDTIVLRGYGRTPMGRGKLRVQWVAADVGSVLGGAPNTYPIEYDTGAPVTNFGSRVLITTAPLGSLGPDRAYHWRLRYRSDSPFFPWTPWFSPARNGDNETDFRTSPSTVDAPAPSVDAGGSSLRFARVFPNPFSESVTLGFALVRAGEVTLTIHDLSGRRVATLLDENLTAGAHQVSWDGHTGAESLGERSGGTAHVPAGVYFARLESAGVVRSRRIVLVP